MGEVGDVGAEWLLGDEGDVDFLAEAEPGGCFAEGVGGAEGGDLVEDTGYALEVEAVVLFCGVEVGGGLVGVSR